MNDSSHHNGDVFLNIDETLVNFTKQSTQQREKERKNKEREDPSESQKHKNPKGSHKGATIKLPSFSYCIVCRLLIIEELYYHMVSHTGW